MKDAEVVRELLRSQESQKMARKTRLEMANAQAEFNQMLANNRKKWAMEEQEHFDRKKEMEAEIKILEERKAKALAPIELIKKEAEEYLEKSRLKNKQAEKREMDAEELNDKLQDKLDDFGKRDQDVAKREQNVSLQKEGIKQQSESIKEQTKQLSEKIKEFAVFRENSEADIHERKKILFLKERSLLAREETQKRTDEALSELGKKLEDDRQTLNRAWQELENKKGASLSS